MTGPDAELLRIFHEESAERLDRIVDSLLMVEGGVASADAVDALFRDVHSIKGNTAMMGFEEARAIAHAMEDFLEQAREQGLLAPELVDPLLRATDAVRRSIAGEPGGAEDIVAELCPAAEPAALATQAPLPTPATEVRPERVASIRVSADKVDSLLDAVGETVLHQRRLEHLIAATGVNGYGQPVMEEMNTGERLLNELQEAVVEMRTLPLTSITGRFPRAVRDLALREGKQIGLLMSGTDTQLDRLILDGISETIVHLLSNAVIHGIEAPAERVAAGKKSEGRLELRAEHRAGMVAIEVSDDGRGVRADLVRGSAGASLGNVLAQAGFSTAAKVSDAAGRGVGLDAVKTHVEALGGSLEIASEPGVGTQVVLLLPLTLALLRVLLVERGGQAFGIALASVGEVLSVHARTSLAGLPSLELRGRPIPLTDLAASIGASAPALEDRPPAVVISSGGERAAVMCDALLGELEVVVKGLGPLLATVPGYLGAGILADGRIAPILDPGFLVRQRRRIPPAQPARAAADASPWQAPAKVLVVDDQFTVRELQRSILEASGYRVETARDGREALAILAGDETIELVVTDIQMPELDGLGLLRAIRQDAARSELPVIVVSSQSDADARRRGADAGADAYIVKQDFDQRALLDTVERLVGA
jgi:two-component system chemotaxis sensor kinase CheA